MENVRTDLEETRVESNVFTYACLNRVHDLSKGDLTQSLMEALVGNCRVAAKIAINLCSFGNNDNGYWNTDLYRRSHETHVVENVGKFSN